MLLRLDPRVDRFFLEAPVRSDLEPGEFAGRGVLVNRHRPHPQVLGKLLDRQDAVIAFSRNRSPRSGSDLLF